MLLILCENMRCVDAVALLKNNNVDRIFPVSPIIFILFVVTFTEIIEILAIYRIVMIFKFTNEKLNIGECIVVAARNIAIYRFRYPEGH